MTLTESLRREREALLAEHGQGVRPGWVSEALWDLNRRIEKAETTWHVFLRTNEIVISRRVATRTAAFNLATEIEEVHGYTATIEPPEWMEEKG